MQYLTAKNLESLGDDDLIYVNRNTLNSTIAEYEIKIEQFQCSSELETLLELWYNIYENEMKTKRIEPFVKMKKKDIERCFRNYKKMPRGSFCIG